MKDRQSTLEMAWRASYEKKQLVTTYICIVFGTQNHRKLAFLKVRNLVRGWIEVGANVYIAIRTSTTPMDSLGAEL